ncbi:hypothetical protein BCV70DRAFT_204069 [Testicularia cyperi]|uniref:Uncharacterized protein n=1 Tax=Testicularia cyperi TaxID=1882483 RepID=A0A317XYQ7_9BASI|nr:hypothetical protein BCV70DRAFT_204069 [Testicularia cyperi]
MVRNQTVETLLGRSSKLSCDAGDDTTFGSEISGLDLAPSAAFPTRLLSCKGRQVCCESLDVVDDAFGALGSRPDDGLAGTSTEGLLGNSTSAIAMDPTLPGTEGGIGDAELLRIGTEGEGEAADARRTLEERFGAVRPSALAAFGVLIVSGLAAERNRGLDPEATMLVDDLLEETELFEAERPGLPGVCLTMVLGSTRLAAELAVGAMKPARRTFAGVPAGARGALGSEVVWSVAAVTGSVTGSEINSATDGGSDAGNASKT